MPVSAGLQKYFDSQKKKSGTMQDSLASLKWQIDPAFMQSFEAFHDKIMWIVDDDPDASELVSEELSDLDMKMQSASRKHNLKKAASIINTSEQI